MPPCIGCTQCCSPSYTSAKLVTLEGRPRRAILSPAASRGQGWDTAALALPGAGSGHPQPPKPAPPPP